MRALRLGRPARGEASSRSSTFEPPPCASPCKLPSGAPHRRPQPRHRVVRHQGHRDHACASRCSTPSPTFVEFAHRRGSIFASSSIGVSYLGVVMVVTVMALHVGFTIKPPPNWRIAIRRDMNDSRHRRQRQGHRQPAQLRDGEVLRQREMEARRFDASRWKPTSGGHPDLVCRSVSVLNFGQALIFYIGRHRHHPRARPSSG